MVSLCGQFFKLGFYCVSGCGFLLTIYSCYCYIGAAVQFDPEDLYYIMFHYFYYLDFMFDVLSDQEIYSTPISMLSILPYPLVACHSYFIVASSVL